MDFFQRTIQQLASRFLRRDVQNNEVELSRMDAYYNAIHKVLSWEDPTVSWMTLGAVHVLFWLIMQLELRIYSIIFLSILTLFLCDLYFEHNGLQEPRSISSENIRQVIGVLQNTVTYFKALRKDNPSFFCGAMCGIFLGLTVIARNFSGPVIIYGIILSIFFGPLIISKLPSEYVENCKQVLSTFNSNDGVVAESELMPFLIGKDLRNKEHDLESLLTDKTGDAEDSLEELEEEDLEFSLGQKATSAIRRDYSSDSDSENRNMSFESSHFNKDSSSEDENFAQGLQFADLNQDSVDAAKAKGEPQQQATAALMSAALLGNLQSIGSNILSNVLRTPSNTPKKSDSDSEFEIINTDDAED